MKRLIITILGGIVAIPIALAIAGMIYLNTIDLKGRTAAALTQALGRQVEIKGSFGLTVYPIVGAVADDITIANIPGGAAARMVTAKQIAVGVEVRPLLNKEVRIRELALIEPVIALEMDASGKPNWIFSPAPGAQPPPAGAPPAKIEEQVTEVRLSGFKITKGAITYADARTREAYGFSEVNATGDLNGLDQPLALRGQATYNNEPMNIDLSMNSPRALIQGKPISLNFNMTSAPATMAFKGALYASDGELKGDIKVSGDDLRRLAQWAGAPIAPGPGLKAFSVDGVLSYAKKATQFNNASVKLDGIAGRGDITIETASGKPYVQGRLETTSVLDVNPYLASTVTPRGQAEPAPNQAAAAAPSAGLDVSQAGWDETPMDFGGLRTLNLNLILTARGLKVQKMLIDDVQMNVFLWDGRLAATIFSMKLYNGEGSGTISLDAGADEIKLRQTLNIDGVDALHVFEDGLGLKAIDGKATLTLNFETQGKTQKELLEKLSGSGAFRFTNGALLGVDFGGVTRTLKNVVEGKVTGPNASTPFKSLRAVLHVRRGVLVMQPGDLEMDGVHVNVAGQGNIDIGKQTLDLRFTPRTVFSRDAQGKAISKGVPLPVRGFGPWTKLQFTTDITGKGKKQQERVVCTVLGGGACPG